VGNYNHLEVDEKEPGPDEVCLGRLTVKKIRQEISLCPEKVKGRVKSVYICSVDDLLNLTNRIAEDLDVSGEEALHIAVLHYMEARDEAPKRRS